MSLEHVAVVTRHLHPALFAIAPRTHTEPRRRPVPRPRSGSRSPIEPEPVVGSHPPSSRSAAGRARVGRGVRTSGVRTAVHHERDLGRDRRGEEDRRGGARLFPLPVALTALGDGFEPAHDGERSTDRRAVARGESEVLLERYGVRTVERVVAGAGEGGAERVGTGGEGEGGVGRRGVGVGGRGGGEGGTGGRATDGKDRAGREVFAHLCARKSEKTSVT